MNTFSQTTPCLCLIFFFLQNSRRMEVLLALFWAHIFAFQADYLTTQLESTLSELHETRHGVHELQVAHNLTRVTLSQTTTRLGSCQAQLSIIEKELETERSIRQIAESKILDLRNEVRALKNAYDSKNQENFDYKESMDLYWCRIAWVSLLEALIIVFLLVNNFFDLFLFLFIYFRYSSI